MNNFKTLEFDIILDKLAEKALSETAKTRCLKLKPSLNEAEVRRWMDESTQARQIIEQTGTPPLSSMTELEKIIDYINIEAMLMPEQIEHVLTFLVSCRKMKEYLRKAEGTGLNIACYGGSIVELHELENEIKRCIVSSAVADKASSQLDGIRRQIVIAGDQIKEKLDDLLRKNKTWFSETFVSVRNGRYTLPVKREHRNDVSGSVIEMSNKGGTCFIEPSSVGKLQTKLDELHIEEDSEVRRILYSLTASISENLRAIKLNMEAMETLDFLFAKGKLSISMNASPVDITTDRKISIKNARHPLLSRETAVPLDFKIGQENRGVVITGPNTGGKTVALKTVGLLSLMAQSGLHVPANCVSSFCMHNMVVCDIGDGQSIAENLSTFSSHMKNVISILKQISDESLVLLDELGSGTDPAEGMGIAVGVLDALREKNCIFVVTTHYPEVKEYADNTHGLVNARMAFDKDSLLPLYRLEIGKAGESCALYIAERLGMPTQVLNRAHTAAYGNQNEGTSYKANTSPDEKAFIPPRIIKQEKKTPESQSNIAFNIGDSVFVYPQKEIGLVYARANEKGEVGVQVKGEKRLINHKRIKLNVPASELYPEDYDFSIVFDTVENRKARHLMGKRHEEGNVIIIKEGESGK
ncbi:MAG: DNA mismatch repair protein MutS [Firmicutes bacterium HGW-Firmicutes-16]|nr:MAG: DNA mismatch repair protein MutS [Firmicutes bacterium HGW-Firmicutes-16]